MFEKLNIHIIWESGSIDFAFSRFLVLLIRAGLLPVPLVGMPYPVVGN